MTKPLLTAERAREVLIYDAETGALNWRVGRPGAPKGALVGTRSSQGYTQVEIDYRLYKAHRVIWLLQTGRWPTHQIDHINGMRADNRWNNLREATPAENARNRRPSATNNTSGRVGVSFDKTREKWTACIVVDGRTIHLGGHVDKADAMPRARQPRKSISASSPRCPMKKSRGGSRDANLLQDKSEALALAPIPQP